MGCLCDGDKEDCSLLPVAMNGSAVSSVVLNNLCPSGYYGRGAVHLQCRLALNGRFVFVKVG
ncbi:MAG: hypothetical protein RUDDFDWM_002050 [Candidatus Fervidibacterota bacterium]